MGVPDISLEAGVPCLVSGLGTSFILLCLFGFEALRGSRACSVGVLHFLRFPLFPCLTLRTSIGPGRSFVLRIGSNPTEASSSGQTNGGERQFSCGGSPSYPGGASFPLG